MRDFWTLRSIGHAGRQGIDLTEVKRALAALADSEHGCELRGLPSGTSFVRPGKDLDGLCEAAKRLDGNDGVYYGLNPIPSNLGHPSRVADVIKRRWLLIDVDPVKPDEHKDNPATDAEKENARQCSMRVMDWLAGQGWPAPVLVDSGNGYHLLYRVDLPNTKHSQAIIKKLLYVLHDRFHDGGKIDRSVHNASRIAKLPGTTARKGVASKERPHRPVVMMNAPAEIELVPEELIVRTAGIETTAAAVQKDPFVLKAGQHDERRYARRALESEIARVFMAAAGERNNTLNTAAFRMGQFVGGGHILRNEVDAALTLVGHRIGLDEREVGPTIKSGLDAGIKSPRQVPERNGQPAKSAAEAVAAGEEITIQASEITPRAVEWLWLFRIPLGKLTTFAGQGGLGKTFVLLDISARVTRGAAWPDLPGETEPGKVLFISGEDDPDDTLVPRLIELGADLTRVRFLKTEVLDRFTLADLKTMEKAIAEVGPELKLVVIDPPTAYLGGVDDHKNSELRALLAPLKSLAAKHRIAIVFNTHVNKGTGAKIEAMARVIGSVAWTNTVRSAHMFAKDPEDTSKRLFIGMKLNIGKECKGLAYRIAETATLARVEWLGEVDTTADEAINKEKRKRRVDATVWLEELFANVDELPSRDIWHAKEDTTISKDQLKEAKDEMGIKARQIYDQEEGQHWVWRWLPADRARWDQVKAKRRDREGARPDEAEF